MSHSKGMRSIGNIRRPRATDRTLTFKASPREKREIEYESEVCGMFKMDYLRIRIFGETITVNRSPRVYLGIKKNLLQVAEELKMITKAEDVTDEIIQKIRFITVVLNGLKER